MESKMPKTLSTTQYGRLLLERGTSWDAIIEKETLASDFNTIPRKVLHVGNKDYITKKWNHYTSQSKWLEDKIYLI